MYGTVGTVQYGTNSQHRQADVPLNAWQPGAPRALRLPRRTVEGLRLDVLTVRHNFLQPMMRRRLAAPIIPIIPFLTMTSRLFSGQSRRR